MWLRNSEGARERLEAFADTANARLGSQRLLFDDRLIVLVRANATTLATALDVLDDVAELRRPASMAHEIADLDASAQAEFVDDLADRIVPPADDAFRICVLDSGVASRHPLLAPAVGAGSRALSRPIQHRRLQREALAHSGNARERAQGHREAHSASMNLPARTSSLRLGLSRAARQHYRLQRVSGEGRTLASIKHIERKISELEGFDVDFLHLDGFNVRGDYKLETTYEYTNRAPASNTVTQWTKNWFKKPFPGFDVAVYEGTEGNVVPGNTKLKIVRDSYGE